MSFLEWVGRVVSLVLAMMVTLSIIGAIAAIPSGSLNDRFGFEPTSPARQQPRDAVRPREPSDRSENRSTVDVSSREAAANAGVATALPAGAQWLEVIAYALLALVCVAALAVLLLWRLIHQLREIAAGLGGR
jgi:hypothetical protein